jgi:hypothetical protein
VFAWNFGKPNNQKMSYGSSYGNLEFKNILPLYRIGT